MFFKYTIPLFLLSAAAWADPQARLLHDVSELNILTAPATRSELPYNYSYVGRNAQIDTVKVLAIRVEFQPDDDLNTTGNGRFGIWDGIDSVHSVNDKKERKWYSDGTYKYDLLEHDSLFVAEKLEYLANYYKKISNDKLSIEYEVFPPGKSAKSAYKLPLKMALYSPGNKKSDETYTSFNERVTRRLMEFVGDAVHYSSEGVTVKDTVKSPFEKIVTLEDGTLWEVDAQGNPSRKVVVLIVHAGASNLTDGYKNSPSDLTDNFINETKIRHFYKYSDIFGDKADTLNGRYGFKFTGYKDSPYIVSELMMISETSNQDSINYGTHGILVNQFARQIGIPDLFATNTGATGIGQMGIMDFEGYSSGNGFIPPYPSAWTRLYMGWDSPEVVLPGNSMDLKAVGTSTENTMAIVPINSHEYWLVENRQRNLTNDASLFTYDTLDGIEYIDADSAINFAKVVDSVTPGSKTIMSTQSQDIGIFGSGIAVWHIDESIIKNRIEYNFINSDSSYRAVSLEEADGIFDIGMPFQGFSGVSRDNGGAEDLFPHTNNYHKSSAPSDTRKSMSPVTSPGTQSNDGGNSYLTLDFGVSTSGITEKYLFARNSEDDNKFYKYFVTNYVDSTVTLTVGSSADLSIQPSLNWPAQMAPVPHFDPLPMDISLNSKKEVIYLDSLGYIYVFNEEGTLLPDSSKTASFGGVSFSYSDSIPNSYCFGTQSGPNLLIPNSTGAIYSYSTIVEGGEISRTSLSTGFPLTTPIVVAESGRWYVGTGTGSILIGENGTVIDTVKLNSQSPVNSLSLNGNQLYAVSESSEVSVIENKNVIKSLQISTLTKVPVFPPFKMVSGDLNSDKVVELAIVDSKQGLFLLQWDESNTQLYPHEQNSFQQFPNDWAGTFHRDTGRAKLPSNGAYPALSDVNGDGNVEIIVPGTNGLYAFSHRGIIIPGWPAFLNRPNWLQRHSVYGSPVTVKDSDDKLLTLFATPSGDNLTYEAAKIVETKTDPNNSGKYVAYYKMSDDMIGYQDSLDSMYLFDTLLDQGDSIIFPFIMPGGLIDARNSVAKRPDTLIATNTIAAATFSPWPITMGSPSKNSPLFVTNSAGEHLLYGSNKTGNVYQWKLSSDIVSQGVWSMTGGNSSRTFSMSGVETAGDGSATLNSFYTYPNPVRIIDNSPAQVSFRYELGQDAQKALLTIYTVDGRTVLRKELPTGVGVNEYTLTDLSRFGSAVYTCRLEVTFNSDSAVKFWKMAVLRGRK